MSRGRPGPRPQPAPLCPLPRHPPPLCLRLRPSFLALCQLSVLSRPSVLQEDPLLPHIRDLAEVYLRKDDAFGSPAGLFDELAVRAAAETPSIKFLLLFPADPVHPHYEEAVSV